ncbi:MAG TPA: pyrroloquinoline quinone biosynthesis protein PqqE [Polyangiaceae bacterium]|nr:pyrroloquinoline quinone biosynthesis protein PqqE [Polyangiaceae bacterium]
MKPRLSLGARVRIDPRDGTPVLLSPERGLRLSPTAAAIVELCDGTRGLDAIVDVLAARYEGADRAQIHTDAVALLAELRGRGAIDDFEEGRSRGRLEEGTHLVSSSPSGEFSPYTLVAELTHRCALACPYCSNPRELVPRHDELTTGEWLRVVDDAASLGVMQVHLSGGEPLARADLEAVAARARKADLYVNLVTSGVPLERDRLERLAPSLDHVQLSVQDADPTASDRVAGCVSFEQKMRVARWVKELHLPLTINTVLHRDNLDRVDQIATMAERLGADRLELANVQLVSWALENRAALLPSRAQIERARTVAADVSRRVSGRMQVVLVLPDWHADHPRACMDGWARRFVVVAPDGAVLPCHAARSLSLEFESVRSRPLRAIWQENAALRAFRGEEWMPEPCKSCDRRNVDFGGCRCQAFALTGDARATDPACPLSPHHALVRAARGEAENAGGRRFVFRGRATPSG